MSRPLFDTVSLGEAGLGKDDRTAPTKTTLMRWSTYLRFHRDVVRCLAQAPACCCVFWMGTGLVARPRKYCAFFGLSNPQTRCPAIFFGQHTQDGGFLGIPCYDYRDEGLR